MRRSEVRKSLILLATATAVAFGSSNAWATVGRIYDGTGYHIANEVGVQYLDTKPWYVEFYDTYTMTKMSVYTKFTATELQKNTGVTVKVTTIVNKTDAPCPGHMKDGGHRIVVRLDPKTARSSAYICGYQNHSDSSRVMFSQHNWDTMGEVYRRHVVSHELGHSIGLGHPPKCQLPGTDPLMCGDYWGGFPLKGDAQKYTSYDIAGLKQLVKNRSL